jgi:hypothetical protein
MANNGNENLTHKYTEKIELMKPTNNGGAWNGKQFLLHLKTYIIRLKDNIQLRWKDT